jgi:hypothetical protein
MNSFRITKACRLCLLLLLAIAIAGCLGSSDQPARTSDTSRGLSSDPAPAPSPAIVQKNPAPTETGPKALRPGPRARPTGAPERKTISGPLGTIARLEPDLATPREPGAALTEKLEGYRTPAEYLLIKSRYVPSAIAAIGFPVDYGQDSARTYPLVIAFGGMGECARPPRDGALAWIGYYKADQAVAALKNNKLQASDFRGLASAQEIREFNKRLEAHPYRGVILACPYSPALTAGGRLEDPEYELFIMEELIPALIKHYRVAPGMIGVDGVSMGGTRSMYYGFKYPDIFKSIGSLQGAFGPFMDQYKELVIKNRDLLKQRSIQLVTSDRDYLAPAVKKMHRMLESEGIRHTYLVLGGPHDYIFNQGPGCLALLVFHNQVLNTASVTPKRR